MATQSNPVEELIALGNQVDTLHELQSVNAVRLKFFKGTLPDSAFELDENGIPAVAHYNTKGDTPVLAITQPHILGILVVYVDDAVIDLVSKYLGNINGRDQSATPINHSRRD